MKTSELVAWLDEYLDIAAFDDASLNGLQVEGKDEVNKVVVAVDGQAGVEVAQRELPDLILMDLSLPVMDGWTATSHLKAQELTRHIPVIALTAHAMTGDREKAIEAGCDEFDTKPVELNRLLSKIEALLGETVES